MMTINDFYICKKCYLIVYFPSWTKYDPVCPQCGPTLLLRVKNHYMATQEEAKKYETGEPVDVQCPICKTVNTLPKCSMKGLFGPKMRRKWQCTQCHIKYKY